MKLNKLLIPVLGATMITSTPMVLVACKDNQTHAFVKEEWNKEAVLKDGTANYYITLKEDNLEDKDVKVKMISDYKDFFFISHKVSGNTLIVNLKYEDGPGAITKMGFDLEITTPNWTNTITGLSAIVYPTLNGEEWRDTIKEITSVESRNYTVKGSSYVLGEEDTFELQYNGFNSYQKFIEDSNTRGVYQEVKDNILHSYIYDTNLPLQLCNIEDMDTIEESSSDAGWMIIKLLTLLEDMYDGGKETDTLVYDKNTASLISVDPEAREVIYVKLDSHKRIERYIYYVDDEISLDLSFSNYGTTKPTSVPRDKIQNQFTPTLANKKYTQSFDFIPVDENYFTFNVYLKSDFNFDENKDIVIDFTCISSRFQGKVIVNDNIIDFDYGKAVIEHEDFAKYGIKSDSTFKILSQDCAKWKEEETLKHTCVFTFAQNSK